MKLNVKSFALAAGLLWGLGLFFLTWWIIAFDGQTHQPTLIGLVYRGYNISAQGSLIGLLYGLLDGALGGALLAWLYNAFTKNSAPTQ